MLSQTLPAPATQLFRYLFEQASLGIAVEDLDGRILLANPALCSMLDYEEHELCAMSCSQFARPEGSGEDWAHFQQLREGTLDHYSLEKRYVRKDGAEIWGRLHVSLLKADDGAPPLVFAFLEEITQRRRTEDALRQSEERFRLAARAGKMYAYEWNVATDVVIRSEDYASVLGYKDQVERLTRKELLNKVHPDDRATFSDDVERVTPSNPRSQMSYRVLRPDGSAIWVEKSQQALFDEQGRMLRVIGIIADISERKRAEEALKRSEANYRMFISQSSEGIFCQELDRPIPVHLPEDEQVQRILHESYMAECNEAMAKMYGFSADAFVGKRLTDTLDAENPANIELTRDYIRSGYRVVDRESHEVDAQGNPKIFLNSMIGIVENGMLLRTWGIQRDVTARAQAEKARALAEQALRDSEQRFRLAAQAGKMFAYEWDAATDVIMRSPEAAQILGIDEAAHVTGQEILAKVHPDDRNMLLAAMAALSPEKPDLQICYRMIRPDGTVIWVDRNSRAHFSEQGTLLRIVGMVVDITDRKLAAETLKKSEEKFSKAFRQSPMALTLTRARDHRYIDVNETFERITGWRRDEIIGRTSLDIEVWADASEMVQITNRLMAEQSLRNLELRFRMRDGSIRTGLSSAELIELEGEPCILGVTADITDYKRAQEALRESEDKLRLLLDSTAEAIYGIDLEHRCTFCNPACLRTLGYERLDEVLGKNMHDLMHHSRADGTLVPVNECRVHRVTQTGEGVHAEDEVFRRANGTNFPAEYWAYPQRKGQELVGAVVAFIDITQRKLAEAAVADVSRRLIEVQEQERARIARELHDDIGQQLSMLAIEIEELQQNSNDLPARVHSRLHEFWQQTCEIATDIQSLSHELHSAKLEYLGIVAAMRGFCNDFGRQQNLQIEFEAKDLVSFPPADASLCLLRVLQEALHNSAKHSGVRQHHVRLWGNEKEVHLTVSDAGAGFNREAVRQNPSGLGLISMEERLKLVNGSLTIESQPKSGTTIHAVVPLRSDDVPLRATG